jgi:hypothetical protein
MRANSDAKMTEHVDFPTPPLGLAMTMTGTARYSPFNAPDLYQEPKKFSIPDLFP